MFQVLQTCRTIVWMGVFVILNLQTYAQTKPQTKTASAAKPMKLLVFSRTKGFRHASIPAGKLAIIKLGKEKGFAVDTTEDASKINEKNLKQYRAVIFLSTTGDVLDNNQQADFERYIQSGGGFVGIHAATDTEYDWPWYNKLVGAQFASHPGNPNVQKGTMHVVDKNHPSTKDLPEQFDRTDEFYDFKSYQKDLVKPLITVDEKTYKDGKMGDFHPMSWYHAFDGGKVFYTNFGHTNETFTEDLFLKHLWGGIQYVTEGQTIDYKKAKSMRVPEENRFNKINLSSKLDEPTELAVLDNGKVLFTERKGAVKLYNPKTQKTKLVATIPVYKKFEYGLMGLNIDPNFNQNQWVYMYYSYDVAPDTANRLVRFKFDPVKDTILLSTEQVIMKVPVKRTDCCHTGGSIAFDKQGNLYLSTGDDTNPFTQKGYAPLDERQGREGWDGQYTSANSNDLRGKILRIKVNEDGTYSIPEGNLFPKGTPKARPEVYVMGNRNPYRISIDQHTGYLYWGEVGPDAGEDSERQGPRGYDEVNQARKAGFFGYPYFIGDNKPYRHFNYADSSSGEWFDPLHPINNSPHNTGVNQLPPAQKAFIWYPYAESPDFPIVGKGGRNAMAGPVYYPEDYQDSNVKFPAYYAGKFFAYDWMRDWVMSVTMNEQGDFVSMERFLPNTKFSHVIDMQFAKDGSLYTLEYGPNWFAQNDEAMLSHITYNAGNRTPAVVATVSKKAGAAPLTVSFSSKGTVDYDNDALKYEWTFAPGAPKSELPNPSFTFAKPGVYKPLLKVTDAKGNVATTQLEVKVGNEVPHVDIVVKGNKSFFWDNESVDYEVKVSDKEDGDLTKGTIHTEDVAMNINYLEGFDKTMIAQGHQMNTGFITGKRLIELSDCKACHSIDKKSIGPAYLDVAKKYKGKSRIAPQLADKVIKGGGGVWGEQAMSAHPQLTKDEATDMVKYILSLADEKKSDPLKGIYVTKTNGKNGTYLFTASYTDKGKGEIGPATAQKTLVLRNAKMKAADFDGSKEIMKYKAPTGSELAVGTAHNSYLMYNGIDLTGIEGAVITVFSNPAYTKGGTLEIHLDAPDGKLIGQGEVAATATGDVKIPFATATGVHSLFFVFKNEKAGAQGVFALDTISFQKKASFQSLK
ncbi:ThuA domain-containing protein [Xanthocytophaga agilis]|uniref:ThuA domain-containing protein n=1 Tax=Xanthocytophaga agilis TaxID=3048010 RepID=A0AAE3R6H3_9BACT|nr:ThuA domain-containing protein [Xanthocytophaga agilis]MDJ1502369.1 ThuA domain-containing protein [Xanthocytophaga agilis]